MKQSKLFAILGIAAALLLASCGKPAQQQNATPVSPQPEPSTQAEAPKPLTQSTTKAETLVQEKPTMAELELKRATRKKTINEIIDLLGEPLRKEKHHAQYLPDCWLYEWDITVISQDDPDIQYPRVGMVFETPTSLVAQYYLDEYLPGRTRP